MKEISRNTIEKAARGDIQAFEIIYQTYASRIYSIASRIVYQPEDAQEVTQDVFLRIFHKLKDFQFNSSLTTWIYRMTVNTALNAVNKSSRHHQRFQGWADLDHHASANNPILDQINAEHQQRTVEECLKILNPDQRACLVLRSMEGLSYQEIAGVLNINVNTVRSRLKRARSKLLAERIEVTQNAL